MEIPVNVTLLVFISSTLSAGAGAFLGSYLGKKGENLATREDLNDLVKQVQAVTSATKEIEAKISGDLWDRQRRWEGKRDALFDATKSLSAVENHFGMFREVVDFGLSKQPPEEQLNLKLFETVKRYSEAKDMLDEAILLVDMICDEPTIAALREVKKVADQKGERLVTKDVEGADALQRKYYRTLYDFKCALRAELGINIVVMPESSEASRQ